MADYYYKKWRVFNIKFGGFLISKVADGCKSAAYGRSCGGGCGWCKGKKEWTEGDKAEGTEGREQKDDVGHGRLLRGSNCEMASWASPPSMGDAGRWGEKFLKVFDFDAFWG